MASMAWFLAPACSTGPRDHFGTNRTEIGALEPEILRFKVYEMLRTPGDRLVTQPVSQCLEFRRRLTFRGFWRAQRVIL